MTALTSKTPFAAGADSGKAHTHEQNTRVLLIDDDPGFCKVMREYLASHSFEPTVAATGRSGIEAARAEEFDVVLLDMFLPDINGIEVLKEIRRFSPVSIIILSAHNEETDKIVALEIGADDYVHKTFSPRELVARVRAVLRRSAQTPVVFEGSETLVVGNMSIDRRTMHVTLDGKRVDLTKLEFQILYILAREPERVFTRDQLFSMIWDRDLMPYDRAVDMHISSLRRKLNDDSRSPMYVRTIRGIGYSFKKPQE